MSDFRKIDSLADPSVKYHSIILAIRHMGYWYTRTFSKGPRLIQFPDHCHTFTKWVAAEPVGRITKENIVKFLHGIVMRFGIPNRLISDNGTQFIHKKFEFFCVAYGIKHPRSSVNHPMTNENVERANGIILQGIKTQIFDKLNAYDKNGYMKSW